jgi:hypothetical protein
MARVSPTVRIGLAAACEDPARNFRYRPKAARTIAVSYHRTAIGGKPKLGDRLLDDARQQLSVEKFVTEGHPDSATKWRVKQIHRVDA